MSLNPDVLWKDVRACLSETMWSFLLQYGRYAFHDPLDVGLHLAFPDGDDGPAPRFLQVSQKVKLYSYDFAFFGRPTGFFTTMGLSANPSFSRTFAFFSITRIVLHLPSVSFAFSADLKISMMSP